MPGLISNRGFLLLAYSVTPVHAGSGRSPGIVDLPVQRDSLGYPTVFASSFKGALRESASKDEGYRGMVPCVFGPDVRDGARFSGLAIFTDLLPVLYPVPSADEGYIYVTTEYLIGRANELSEILIGKKVFPVTSGDGGNPPRILLTPLKPEHVKGSVATGVKMGSMLKERAYVLSDSVGLAVIESSLIRITRNRLKADTKTVEGGALWTEEYLPAGTLMVGGVIDSGRKSDMCKGPGDYLDGLRRFLEGRVIVLGGKETIGRGLVRFGVL
jgi:CRISPR-associated protein Cmr4